MLPGPGAAQLILGIDGAFFDEADAKALAEEILRLLDRLRKRRSSNRRYPHRIMVITRRGDDMADASITYTTLDPAKVVRTELDTLADIAAFLAAGGFTVKRV